MPSAPPALAATRVADLLGDFPRTPAFRGLADGLRSLIAEGRVPVGARLPSERDLTGVLAVSRTTVTRAYDLLREERYLESRQGSGSVTRLPVSLIGRTDHLLGVQNDPGDDRIDLTIAAPPAPPGMLAAYERAAARFGSYAAGTGYYPTGVPALLEALADRFTARGLPTDPDQLVVVGGALAGLSAVTQVLVRPGDRALVELPTYPNPIATLRARSARLVTTPVDPEHGWDVDHALGAARGAKLAYLVPDFQNPTGALMPAADRERLGAGLSRLGVVPLVDESLVDTALGVEVPPPFASYAPGTVTVGSASKSFWGGLRIGWVRAPRDQVAAIRSARLSLDLASAPFEQLVLLELMADEAALRSARREALVASRTAALAAIAEHLPDWRVTPSQGGLSLWCRLPAARSTALAVAAEERGVLLASGPAFAADGGLDHWVRIPCARPPHVMTEAVRRIGEAWAGLEPGSPRRPAHDVVLA